MPISDIGAIKCANLIIRYFREGEPEKTECELIASIIKLAVHADECLTQPTHVMAAAIRLAKAKEKANG